MNFLESVELGFSNWKNFSGRACRSEYWYFVLFSVPALLLVILVSGVVNSIVLAQVLIIGGGAFIYVPAFALVVRRLHDQNITGWAIVIGFVPVLGELIIFIAMCYPGTDGDNRYGPPRVPLKRRDAVSVSEPQGSWVDKEEQNSQAQYGRDPVMEMLKSEGLPVTRENYLMLAYPDLEDWELGAEEESMLPEELQLKQ